MKLILKGFTSLKFLEIFSGYSLISGRLSTVEQVVKINSLFLHKAITRINTTLLVRNWSDGSEYITISCYRWDLHSCFFQTNRRSVSVFSVIDMPEISEGTKLRGIWVFLKKKHQSVFIHTQCLSNFEMHFGLFPESNREANTLSKLQPVDEKHTAFPDCCCLGHSVE